MLDYEVFRNIFDEKIFAKTKPELLEKVADYPDRYVGLFRPTRPKTKLIQNMLTSSEIRFGDAFEVVIGRYLAYQGWQPLEKVVTAADGETLNIDQLMTKDNQVLFIEQKVRDDHDSTKKRGQIDNFNKKLQTLIEKYDRQVSQAYFYFIDPSLKKNSNYYRAELEKLSQHYHIHIYLSYGQEMFDQLHYPHIWQDIQRNLQLWRNDLPDMPEIDYDLLAEQSAEELGDMAPHVFNRLFNNQRIVEQILPVIFSNGLTFRLLEPIYRQKGTKAHLQAASHMRDYINSRLASMPSSGYGAKNIPNKAIKPHIEV